MTILVQGIYSKDYILVLESLYGAQLIFIISLGPISMTPHLAFFIQRMSIFSFVEPLIQDYAYGWFHMVNVEQVYNSGYYTNNFIVNSIIPF